jgi:uncharacterized lipoprotein YddW (UPF0748 family)
VGHNLNSSFIVLKKSLIIVAFLCAPLANLPAVDYQPSVLVPPVPAREFRGLWIATVANIDWPSRPGLSTAEQKQELIAILDRASQLKFNAVIFQVRPACDAFYASRIEPWSEYLTGTMGKAPSPFYDPLAFAITEAHRRGLELHAWFNPYRALHFSAKSPPSANHILRTHPELVKKYGRYYWLDPGEPAVRDYSLGVVLDVVKRYDIDGVHFDDYFYPDPAEGGSEPDFPDAGSWREQAATAGLSRDDWRRHNVDIFVERTYFSIKALKPWVKFGISPPGIWRPGNPPQIKGMDAYLKIYADSRRWFSSGRVDYLAPQLYWPIESREQSFGALLTWWTQQNPKHRLLWPGLYVARASQWKPDEIPNQIRLTRNQPGVSGYLCYNTSSLVNNRTLSDAFENEINIQPALVPAMTWSGNSNAGKPSVSFRSSAGTGVEALFQPAPGTTLRWWLVQTRSGNNWKTELMPAGESVRPFGNSPPDVMAVSGVDRFGVASRPVVFQKKAAPARPTGHSGVNRRF